MSTGGIPQACKAVTVKKIEYQVADRLRMMRDLSVADACELLGVTKQAWYEYHRQSFEDAIDEDMIVECVRSIRMDMPTCGGRKIKELLRKDFGLDIGRDKLFEILDRYNLLIKPRRKRTRTTFSDHGLLVYPDLRKEFEPTGINQLWVSDITSEVALPIPRSAEGRDSMFKRC